MSDAIADAARLLGAKASEVAGVEEADAGTIITLVDGTALIDVPEDKPDIDGKTGVMFLVAPLNVKGEYLGSFPVFSQPVEADALDEAGGDAYPAKGSTADVLAWVAGDEQRAEYALEQENESGQRKGLTEELEAILAQYAGGDSGQ